MLSLANIQLGSNFFNLTPFAVSCLITTVFSLALGVFVYFKQKKALLNRLWMAVSLTTSAWSLGFLGVVTATNQAAAFRWQCLLDVAAIFIPVFFLHFLLIFLNQRGGKRYRRRVTIVYLLGLTLSILSFSPLFKKEMTSIFGFDFWVNPGMLYPLFPLFFLGIALYAFYLLIRNYFKLKEIKKLQTKYILIAVTLGFGGGVTNFFPQLIKVYPAGNYFVAFYIFFVAYAITHYRLLNLKIVATEILVAAISVALFVDTFLATSLLNTLFKLVIFVIFVYLGISLVRSVQNEIKRREQLEKMAEELEIANARLRKLDQAKTEFLAISSHQLRTPLTAIRGYLAMIRRGHYGSLSKSLVSPVEEVYQSTLRLIKLTNRLLDVSRIEAGKLKVNFQPTSLTSLIKSVLEEIKPEAEEKGLSLKFTKSEKEIPELELDQEKIRQVLLNILDNALKYTQKGEIKIGLSLTDSKGVRIKIQDTGEGMTKEELSKVFQSFSRGLAGEKFHSAGAGLGLYIAKEFIHLHKGKIWATSPGEGRGTTFWIELPLDILK